MAIIEIGESTSVDIEYGVKNIFKTNVLYKYIIETTGGSIIEGFATPNDPLEITPGSDIKSIKAFLTDRAFIPLHLLKPGGA